MEQEGGCIWGTAGIDGLNIDRNIPGRWSRRAIALYTLQAATVHIIISCRRAIELTYWETAGQLLYPLAPPLSPSGSTEELSIDSVSLAAAIKEDLLLMKVGVEGWE